MWRVWSVVGLSVVAQLVACGALIQIQDRYAASRDDGSPPVDASNAQHASEEPTIEASDYSDASVADALVGDPAPDAGGSVPDPVKLDGAVSDATEAGAAAGDSSGANDACDESAAGADFFVDPSMDGAGGCAFRTITAAVSAASLSRASSKTIHVAKGFYSAASGESLPLVLRDGVSLVGAGADQSVLIGTGPVSHRPPTNFFGPLGQSPYVSAALVVGDATKSTLVSGLGLTRGASSSAGTEAIVCDRGNASLSAPAPNMNIRGVRIDGFEIGVRVTWSFPDLSGCNVLVTQSQLMNGQFGVVADGLTDAQFVPSQVVSVQLGDGSRTGGNEFHNFRANDSSSGVYFNGAGLATINAVTGVAVRGNRFLQDASGLGQTGIWAVQQSPYELPGYDIEDNDFGPLSNTGITMLGRAVIGRLTGNTFHEISMEAYPSFKFLGVALAVYADALFPFVTYARRNMFFGNDIGVSIHASRAPSSTETGLQNDFGTVKDFGGNTFRCNAAASNLVGSGPGGDVVVAVAPSMALGLPFAGNVWDHAPPTTWFDAIQSTAPAGIDLFVYGKGPAGAPNVDVAGAALANSPACPSGRPAGP